MDRKIVINLLFDNIVKEFTICNSAEARALLHTKMASRWKYAIDSPDLTGAICGDEERYAEDCLACGVKNPYQEKWK